MTASANVKATYVLKYYTGAAWSDITSDAIRNPFSVMWGMPDNEPLTFVAGTGQCTFTLNNTSGHYTPESATVSTGWAKGTPVQLILTYDGVDYVRFRGRVDTLILHSELQDAKTVDVTCLDWIDFAAKYPLLSPQVANYLTGDVAAATIIAAMPIKPTAQLLDPGNYLYPSLFDAVSVRTTAYEEFNKLALSEMAYCYLKHDKVNGEMFILENNIRRTGITPLSVVPKMKADSGFILKAGSAVDYVLKAGTTDKLIPCLGDNDSISNIAMSIDETYGENIINRFVINTYPKTIDTSAVTLYNLGAPIKIASGETKTIHGTYRNPVGGKEISGLNMITPVATTDYLFNTEKDGTGTNITADLGVVCSYDSSRPTYALTNNSTSTGWVTYLKARGYGIYQDDVLTATLEDSTSETAYGYHDLTLEQAYQQDTDLGTLNGTKILEYNKAPHVKVNAVTFNANLSTFTMQAFLNTDVGSLIQLVDTLYGVNDYFYVQGITFTLEISGLINVTWALKRTQSIASGGLTAIAVNFHGTGLANDALNFGSIPGINNLSEMSISLWVNHPVEVVAANQNIISSYDGLSGFRLFFYRNTTQVHFTNFNWSGTAGWWNQDDHNLTDAQFNHVVITINLLDYAAPIIYANGALTAVATDASDTGSHQYPVSNNLIIGNGFYFGELYTVPLNGILKDVRIYNRILSTAEVTAIYNAGTPSTTAGATNGMIFQGPCVRTAEKALYEGAVLSSSLPVLDNVNGYVGNINGSPDGVAF